MGKFAQIGDLDEIIRISNIDESYYPCIDFGHLNARSLGGLKTYEDYENVIKKLLNGVGREKTENMHVHFSKIMFSGKGEVRHLTFDDDVYGPEFPPLARVFSITNSRLTFCRKARARRRKTQNDERRVFSACLTCLLRPKRFTKYKILCYNIRYEKLECDFQKIQRR